MAYAVFRESLDSIFPGHFAVSPVEWLVLDVTVPSRDAFLVRRALAGCPDVTILRCIPRLDANLVRVEIKLCSNMKDEVMHRVICGAPGGEVGAFSSWRTHLLRHGLCDGH